MSKTKVDFSALAAYLPNGSFEPVLQYIYDYRIQLTITKTRSSVLGDYRHAHNGKGHRISVNGDLNKYAFLITLLHEIAHLITFIQHNNKVPPHGKEWKAHFSQLLAKFITLQIFPTDVQKALATSIKNPAASSCSDDKLLRVLKNYDPVKEGYMLVDDLPVGAHFLIKDHRIFEKGEKIRKRIKCKEIATNKWYLFSPLYEVKYLK
ncbi:SprT-like domain-containing protein [Ferruginibacter yonginensis]|uniref:SprT-like domain-containing protein n=1 Tax=Ferruginibacter yonginensis TaxID=1310416 RepID=A0ABV8QW48_9BACT